MADRLELDPDRWQRAVEIFERALELPHAVRDPFIIESAGNDSELAQTVRGMLAADSTDADILDDGLTGVAHIAGAFPDDHPLNIGDILGNFEIVGELGRGGMGVVYSARDRSLGRIAALKLLPHSVARDPVATERLLAEAQAASALDHPNVATIYQVGDHDGRRFIAMARYEGETLRSRLSRGPVETKDAINITRQVAAGLAAAHAAGLVHRDVKPANIFLTRQGLVKLLDFGIATLSGPEFADATTRGTVRYMSPEQARGEPVDSRSDIWSLGVVLYEMITGHTPFGGDDTDDVIASITNSARVTMPSAVPTAIRSVVSRALEKDRTRRLESASHLMEELDRLSHRQRTRWRNIAVAAASLVVATAALLSMRDEPAPADIKPTIAILPIASDSANRESATLAAGLVDEVAARLIGLGRVRVVRSSDTDRSAAYQLNVDVQMKGVAPVVAVTMQRSRDRKIVWEIARPFDTRELRELSRTLVIGILDAAGTPATEKERSQIGSGFPSNAEAYREFLVGNRLLSIRTPAAVESAVVHYRRAAMLDTAFASAYARQSYAYSILSDWGWKVRTLGSADPLTDGLALADRALAFDSTSADPWLARAYILVQRDQYRFSGAVEAFQHAISLDPYNAEAFHQYGQTLMGLGRFTEALAAYRRAMDLEPDRSMTLVPIGAIYKRQGKIDEGLRYLDSAVRARPEVAYARSVRSFHRSFMGDAAGARADAEEALRLDSNFRVPALASLAKALWLQGDTAAALARINEAERACAVPGTPSPTESFMLAITHVAMNRIDRAERALRTSKPRGAWLWFYYTQPELASFVKLPGPKAILAEADPRRAK